MKTTQNFHKWLLQLNIHTSLDARHYIDCNTDLDESEIDSAEIGNTMLKIFQDKQLYSTTNLNLIYTKDLRRLYLKKYQAFGAEDYRKFDNLDGQMHEILTRLTGISDYDTAYRYLANIKNFEI